MSIINQYENMSLGTCSEGCRCHIKVRLDIIDNSVDDYEVISEIPHHIIRICDSWAKDSVEEINGELVWKQDDFILIESEEDSDEENGNEVKGAYKEPLDNNNWYMLEGCGSFNDSLECAINFSTRIKEPDGVYTALIEMACWTEYHYEGGLEGEGESEIKILDRVGDIEESSYE
jgi:hypothetical protein